MSGQCFDCGHDLCQCEKTGQKMRSTQSARHHRRLIRWMREIEDGVPTVMPEPRTAWFPGELATLTMWWGWGPRDATDRAERG